MWLSVLGALVTLHLKGEIRGHSESRRSLHLLKPERTNRNLFMRGWGRLQWRKEEGNCLCNQSQPETSTVQNRNVQFSLASKKLLLRPQLDTVLCTDMRTITPTGRAVSRGAVGPEKQL